MNCLIADDARARFTFQFESNVKILDRESGHHVLKLTSYIEHGEIAFEIADIIARGLNAGIENAVPASIGPFVARVWETNGRDGQPGRAAGVWDIRRPHPLQGLLTATALGKNDEMNSAIVHAAQVAAGALNACNFDWQSPHCE